MKFRSIMLGATLLVSAASAPAAWHEARSKHFTVYADGDAAEVKQFAERLERFDAAVREARGVPDVPAGAAMHVTLFILRDLRELRQIYGERESSVAGFYRPKVSGSVAFIPQRSAMGKFELRADSIFFHEYTHHLMLQDADRPLPGWYTEGMAEFFANPEFKSDGSVVIGIPPRYRAEVLYSKTEQMPLKTMLSGDFKSVTPMEYETIYGRGWLLTHLLSFDLKRRGQLTRYLNDIEGGVPASTAAQNAFGDLKILDRELDVYFKKQIFTIATIPATKLRVANVELRVLPRGEARMMPIKIRLERGDRIPGVKALAGRARAIALESPDSAAVHTTLAQIELEAGYPQAALKAAERAIEFDPKSTEALVATAKAMLALAKETPSSPQWNAIRVVIGKANRIDPENAEPLMLFYRTFVAQGVQPSKSAMDGLEYAVALAPQDTELRMELVGELIEQGRFDDARRILIPLAYSPHRGKWHDAIVAVFDQVTARNKAEAKAKWNAALAILKD